jgi:hypothetical protein
VGGCEGGVFEKGEVGGEDSCQPHASLREMETCMTKYAIASVCVCVCVWLGVCRRWVTFFGGGGTVIDGGWEEDVSPGVV